MALFRRKQTTDIPELKEYYEAQKRDRPFVAWALAIISLLITIVIVLAIFFAGRWLYRTLFNDDNDDSNNSTAQQEDADSANESQTTPPSEGDAAIGTTEGQTQGANSESTNNSTTQSTPTTTPATGALPNTGPSEPEL